MLVIFSHEALRGPAIQNRSTPAISYEETQKGSNDGAGENASDGYLASGTAEEITDCWSIIDSTPPCANMTISLSGRTWDRSSTLASIQ